MYLNKSIQDEAGNTFDMVGVVDGECAKRERLVRFGYVQIKQLNSDDNLTKESFDKNNKTISLKEALNNTKAHEFHYYDSTSNGADMVAYKAGDDKKWEAIHVGENHVWGFPHLYFESNTTFAEKFVEVMRNGRK